MKKSVYSSIIAAMVLSVPALALAEPVTSKFNLSVGGFVKLDYAYNSVNFGNNGGLSPAGAVPADSAATTRKDQSIFTARQSRLWFKVAGPELMGAKTGALIETDFYGDTSAAAESPQLRMRLAYGTLDWKSTQVLFGQNWDIFGPFVASTVDFRSGAGWGAPNNPRVPQARLTHKISFNADNALTLVAGVQDPNQNANNNQQANTSHGAAVNAAGQIMFSSKALGVAPGYFGLPMKPLTVGVFGLYGNSKLNTGSKTIDSYGGGVYAFVPVLKSADGKGRAMSMSLEGQAYQAGNMAFNTATPGTFVGTTADPKEAKGYGLGAQVIFYPTQELGLTAGFGRRGAMDYDDYRARAAYDNALAFLEVPSRTINTAFAKSSTQFYGNVSYDLNAAVRVMAEYQNLETDYGKALSANDEKAVANVFRLAAFYFF